MTALVRVDAAAYEAASAVLGHGVAESLAEAGWALIDRLSGSAGMAGDDPAGSSWAHSYDRAADAAVQAASDVITASFRLAALLEQTGFNYGTAESSSVPGGTVPSHPDRTPWEWRACTLQLPPSARGSGIAMPSGWSLVADAVGLLWPNGHQDRLRCAAGAWGAFSSDVLAASYEVTRAFACLVAEDAPETPDALAACRSIESELRALACATSALGQACAAYADHLDAAHHEVDDELVSLLEWTAGIEAAGGIFAAFTFGGSEVAAQAAEASRIAGAATRIASALSKLAALARAAAAEVADVASRVAAIGDALRPLLTSRIVVALAERAEPLRVATSAAEMSEERLAVAGAFEQSIAGQRAIEYATTPEKLIHVFAPKHKLEALVTTLGSEEAVMRSLLIGVSTRAPQAGRFTVALRLENQTVVVRGAIVDGVIRIGTAFTP